MRGKLNSSGYSGITTVRAGCVSWLNPVAERLTGWPATEAVGRPAMQVLQIVDGETRLPALDPIARCLEQGVVTGLATITFVLYTWIGPKRLAADVGSSSVPAGVFWGGLAGFGTTVAEACGRPYQGWGRAEKRGKTN